MDLSLILICSFIFRFLTEILFDLFTVSIESHLHRSPLIVQPKLKLPHTTPLRAGRIQLLRTHQRVPRMRLLGPVGDIGRGWMRKIFSAISDSPCTAAAETAAECSRSERGGHEVQTGCLARLRTACCAGEVASVVAETIPHTFTGFTLSTLQAIFKIHPQNDGWMSDEHGSLLHKSSRTGCKVAPLSRDRNRADQSPSLGIGRREKANWAALPSRPAAAMLSTDRMATRRMVSW